MTDFVRTLVKEKPLSIIAGVVLDPVERLGGAGVDGRVRYD